MSDLLTTYVTFSAIDYKNQNILSSYALSSTPFTFLPDLILDSGNRVLWSFGDGTTSSSLCAVKSFTYPGQYTINLFVYDCYGNVRASSYSQTVTIHDLFPMSFQVETPSGTYNTLSTYNSKITGPFTIKAQYPIYQTPVDIYYNIFPAPDMVLPIEEPSYYNISAFKYSHLMRYNSFYQKIYNYYLSSFQYQEIDKISPSTVQVFAKIVNGEIVTCPSTDEGSFFIGLSGYKEVFIKSDTPNDEFPAVIDLKFDNTRLYSPFEEENVEYYNNLGISISANILPNPDFSRLSITSNGLDGEGYPISSFNITPIKFQNVQIPFVIRPKDSDNFTNKGVLFNNLISFSVISGSTVIPSTYWSMSSLAYTLSSFTSTETFRGYITFKNLTSPLSNIQLSAVFNYTDFTFNSTTLGGATNKFTVYTDKYYDIYKRNEDFDMQETLKSLRFQEFLFDKNILFDDFLGTIFGNISSTYDTLGKKIYEKIANFVENNVDIDRDEIYSLLSQMEMMNNDTNIYDSTLMNYPDKIKRVLNLASISKNRLIGTPNQFKENFDIKGRSQKTEYGINLGNQIDNDTYTISANIPIVALERFSGDYTLLNTFQPVCALSTNQYKLSSYTSNWGWPLVLPSDFTYRDFPKYYTFFEFIDVIDGRNSDNTIDFHNSMTTVLSTVSNDQLFGTYGIFENMIANTLYDSLSLFVV